jgi:hypothetical protein
MRGRYAGEGTRASVKKGWALRVRKRVMPVASREEQ